MLEINYTNRNNIHKTYKIGLDWIGYYSYGLHLM